MESVFGKEEYFFELLMGTDHFGKDVGVLMLFECLQFLEFVELLLA